MSEQERNEMENQEVESEKQPKKITLEEAIKRKLAEKKQAQANAKGGFNSTSTKVLKNQQTKKPNNQRRRTGGS